MTVTAPSFDLSDADSRYRARSIGVERPSASRFRPETEVAATAAAKDDPLRPARGLVIGLLLVVPFWLVVLGILFWR